MARSIIAGILLVLSVLAAPVAAAGAWARAEILDTDTFVATTEPLIDEPEVRVMLRDQTMAAINRQVDLETLGVPAVEEAISDGLDKVIASDTFAKVWSAMLKQAHERSVQLFEDDPKSAAELAEDGTLALDLGVLVEEFKQSMLDEGLEFASLIPEVSSTVEIVAGDSFKTARTAYHLTDTWGMWLPIIVGALLVIGVLLARERLVALARTAGAYVFMFLVLLAGVVLGEEVLARSMSGDSISSDAATTIYERVFDSLWTFSIVLASASAAVCLLAIIANSIVQRRAARPRPAAPVSPGQGVSGSAGAGQIAPGQGVPGQVAPGQGASWQGAPYGGGQPGGPQFGPYGGPNPPSAPGQGPPTSPRG